MFLFLNWVMVYLK